MTIKIPSPQKTTFTRIPRHVGISSARTGKKRIIRSQVIFSKLKLIKILLQPLGYGFPNLEPRPPLATGGIIIYLPLCSRFMLIYPPYSRFMLINDPPALGSCFFTSPAPGSCLFIPTALESCLFALSTFG